MIANSIYLSRAVHNDLDGWMATYQGPHAQEIIDLFGTHQLPTAYTDAMGAREVQAKVEALNPGVFVYTVE